MVKLVPEYGYQLTDFSINGGSFGTGDEQSVFSFEIKRGNFHLGAHFTKVEDAVNAVSDKVKEGTIELGGQEINSGSVVLSVEDVTLSSEQISNFEDKAGEYSISSYLDINLNQVIYKGTDNADDAWKTELKELNNKADITLKLEQGVNGSEVVIVHEKHDGTFEIIPATYNAATNMITFEADSFSNYAIAVMDVPVVPDDSDDSYEPDEPAKPETKPDSSNIAEKTILTKTDGSVAKNEWVMKNGKWYYAGDKGTAETGWFKDESSGKWYYLDDKSGEMSTGWKLDKDGKWYYLDTQSGSMVTGWKLDKDGKWYYLDTENGAMATGWVLNKDGKWYYLNPLKDDTLNSRPYGSMYINEMTPDGYMVDKNGAWIQEQIGFAYSTPLSPHS